MSFKIDEFDALIDAYRERRWEDLWRMLQDFDPESIAAAEEYLGVKLSDFARKASIRGGPIRIGTGRGKIKKYTKPHSKKFYSKKIKRAKTKKEKDFWKATKSSRLAELRKIKQKKDYQNLREKIRRAKTNKLINLTRKRESLKRQARRYKINVPQARIPKKYKMITYRIKSLEKSNKILKSTLKKIIKKKYE